MATLLQGVNARLSQIPVHYLGSPASVEGEVELYFEEVAAFLASPDYLPRVPPAQYDNWDAWTPNERTLITDLVTLRIIDRIVNLVMPALSNQSASDVEVTTSPRILTKGKAGEAEATWGSLNMIQKQAAGTVVVNVAKMLETASEPIKNRIQQYAALFAIDLNLYLGKPFYDNVRVPIYLS